MSEADTVPTEERLPWLGEEAEPVRDHRTRDAIGLAIVAALLIFGVSYWIASSKLAEGARAGRESTAVAPPAAVPLPKAPQAVATRHHPKATTAPSAAPRVAERPATRTKQQLAAKAPSTSEVAKAVTETKIAATKPATTTPAKEVATSTPVTGRIVRVGAFASPIEAKLGWRRWCARTGACAFARRRGRRQQRAIRTPSYRFEIGTTSEANSAVLCQRMERINFACVEWSRLERERQPSVSRTSFLASTGRRRGRAERALRAQDARRRACRDDGGRDRRRRPSSGWAGARRPSPARPS